jgi:hypothetical protein
MFYNSLVKFRDEQLENYQGQPLEYSASDYHHISKFGEKAQRGRTETGGANSKRRSPAIKNLHRRLGNTQEPMSPASVQSYDPFRSPKAQRPAVEAKFAQITVHHAVPEIAERGEVSPVGKPPPSIMEVEEPEDENEASDSPFTVLQKRKHKPNSMKSLQSSKMPNSSSRLPGLSTHSTSYRRNVSFRHARNRSQGSTKPKRRKTTTNQQGELKRSPSAASLQMIADGLSVPDMPSSPPLPAQPTVVRSGNKVKNLDPPKRFRHPDIVWKEDARKVSHELSQICEEAFNGSSVTTIRTASTSTETGYETPTTPVSMASPERVDQLSNARNSYHPPRESSRSYSIQELTETRQKLVDHSSGRTDNIPGYLSGVIGHLDRLIEEEQSQKFSKGLEDNEPRYVDPFFVPTPPTGELPLPAISEEFASPVRGNPDEVSPKRRPKLRHTTRHGDGKATIRMVPHSSLRSMEEVKPLMIRKKSQLAEPETQITDPMRAFSAGSRQSRNPGGLDPISEVPGSPKKDEKSTENKKWSWFRARSQTSDPLPALPPKDTPPIIPSNGTVIVNPLQEPQSPTRPEGRRVPTRKTSMERFGGALKKLVSKKSNRTPQPVIGRLNPRSCTGFPLRLFEDKDSANPKDRRQSELLCKGYPETDSSFEADDPQNPFHNKRRSIANHNWFARVFQLKPATRVIALNTGKVKGRKVVHHLLLDWEDYGMEDVRLDKANSVVHGRVGEVNCKFLFSHFPRITLIDISSPTP